MAGFEVTMLGRIWVTPEAHQKAAELYVKACREEVSHFTRLREGHKSPKSDT
jgi:hypothetical protein